MLVYLFMGSRLDQIAVLAARYRIPAMFRDARFRRRRRAISYGTSIARHAYRQAGIYVDQDPEG